MHNYVTHSIYFALIINLLNKNWRQIYQIKMNLQHTPVKVFFYLPDGSEYLPIKYIQIYLVPDVFCSILYHILLIFRFPFMRVDL